MFEAPVVFGVCAPLRIFALPFSHPLKALELERLFGAFGNASGLEPIFRRMNPTPTPDPDAAKGAVEPSRPENDAEGNVASFNEQLDHRFQDPLNKSSDSGMSGSGQIPEFSMETQGKNELDEDTGDPMHPQDADSDAGANTQRQDTGETQRPNKAGQKEDPMAA